MSTKVPERMNSPAGEQNVLDTPAATLCLAELQILIKPLLRKSQDAIIDLFANMVQDMDRLYKQRNRATQTLEVYTLQQQLDKLTKHDMSRVVDPETVDTLNSEIRMLRMQVRNTKEAIKHQESDKKSLRQLQETVQLLRKSEHGLQQENRRLKTELNTSRHRATTLETTLNSTRAELQKAADDQQYDKALLERKHQLEVEQLVEQIQTLQQELDARTDSSHKDFESLLSTLLPHEG